LIAAAKAHDRGAFHKRLVALVKDGAGAGDHEDRPLTSSRLSMVSTIMTMQKNTLVFAKFLKGGRRDFIVGVVEDDTGVFVPAGDVEFAKDMDGNAALEKEELIFVRRIRWIRRGVWDHIPEDLRKTIFKGDQLTVQQQMKHADRIKQLLFEHSVDYSTEWASQWWATTPYALQDTQRQGQEPPAAAAAAAALVDDARIRHARGLEAPVAAQAVQPLALPAAAAAPAAAAPAAVDGVVMQAVQPLAQSAAAAAPAAADVRDGVVDWVQRAHAERREFFSKERAELGPNAPPLFPPPPPRAMGRASVAAVAAVRKVRKRSREDASAAERDGGSDKPVRIEIDMDDEHADGASGSGSGAGATAAAAAATGGGVEKPSTPPHAKEKVRKTWSSICHEEDGGGGGGGGSGGGGGESAAEEADPSPPNSAPPVHRRAPLPTPLEAPQAHAASAAAATAAEAECMLSFAAAKECTLCFNAVFSTGSGATRATSGCDRYIFSPCQHTRACSECAQRKWHKAAKERKCPWCNTKIGIIPYPFKPFFL
jgi:hypothetical protein